MPIVPFTSAAPHTVRGLRHISQESDLPPSYELATLTLSSVSNDARPRPWEERRESPHALPRDHPRTAFPACGVLPEKVLSELKRALARRQRTDLNLHAARDRLGCLLQQAPERQEQPSAPSYLLIGNGLFDNVSGSDAPSHREIRQLQERVAALAEKKQKLAARHLDDMKRLELKQLKLEARCRPKAPPANPPAAGYLPSAARPQPATHSRGTR